MDLKAGASIHNRFDIRVIRDGKVIQEAQAENIVLDRMYTRICAFNTYFDYIHFGTGTGTQSASRTTLFTPTGYKSASTVETIYAFPTSKVTKNIQIMPEEYVGSIFTEVGISESTSAINTHALIRDSEGVQISITKTALDLVEIYATVYIELQDNAEQGVHFYKPARYNEIVKYFVSGTSLSNAVRLDLLSLGEPSLDMMACTNSNYLASVNTTISSLSAQKKGVWNSRRFDINTGNGIVTKIGVENAFFVAPSLYPGYSGTPSVSVGMGTGDGVQNTLNITSYKYTNFKVFEDATEVPVTVTEGITQDTITLAGTALSVYFNGGYNLVRTPEYILHLYRGNGSNAALQAIQFNDFPHFELNTVCSEVGVVYSTEAFAAANADGSKLIVVNVTTGNMYIYNYANTVFTFVQQFPYTDSKFHNLRWVGNDIYGNGNNIIQYIEGTYVITTDAAVKEPPIYSYRGRRRGSDYRINEDILAFYSSDAYYTAYIYYRNLSGNWVQFNTPAYSDKRTFFFIGTTLYICPDYSTSSTYTIYKWDDATKSFGSSVGTVQLGITFTCTIMASSVKDNIYCIPDGTNANDNMGVYYVKLLGDGYTLQFMGKSSFYKNKQGTFFGGSPTFLNNSVRDLQIIRDGDKIYAVMLRAGSTYTYDYVLVYSLSYATSVTLTAENPFQLGAALSIKYDTPHIHKSTDYVLDVGFTLQFGEGTV